ncbi:hypothetical protein BKX95_10030 [Streptococcus iniae]|nr:hypothetical protein BKX95_10030 [Streptococcus iniae]
MKFTNKKDHLLYTAEQYNEQLRLDGGYFEKNENAYQSDFISDPDITYVICDGELNIKKTAENLEEAKIEKFKLDYKDEYPKDIINSFTNFMKEGVDEKELTFMHKIFEEYDEKPSANQFEKNLSDQLEEWREVDQLFTSISRNDIPNNVFQEKEILNVLASLEYKSETGYIWTEPDDFLSYDNAEELSNLTTNYIESGKMDQLYQSDLVELTVGDNTFMVDTIDLDYSPYSMESLVDKISQDLETKPGKEVLENLKNIKKDFEKVNNIVTNKIEEIVQDKGIPLDKELTIQESLDKYAENHKIELKQDQEQERGI